MVNAIPGIKFTKLGKSYKNYVGREKLFFLKPESAQSKRTFKKRKRMSLTYRKEK